MGHPMDEPGPGPGPGLRFPTTDQPERRQEPLNTSRLGELRGLRGLREMNQVALRIHGMERHECIEELLKFRDIPLDFNAAYLNQMSSDRLRHVLLAAVITVRTRKAG